VLGYQVGIGMWHIRPTRDVAWKHVAGKAKKNLGGKKKKIAWINRGNCVDGMKQRPPGSPWRSLLPAILQRLDQIKADRRWSLRQSKISFLWNIDKNARGWSFYGSIRTWQLSEAGAKASLTCGLSFFGCRAKWNCRSNWKISFFTWPPANQSGMDWNRLPSWVYSHKAV